MTRPPLLVSVPQPNPGGADHFTKASQKLNELLSLIAHIAVLKPHFSGGLIWLQTMVTSHNSVMTCINFFWEEVGGGASAWETQPLNAQSSHMTRLESGRSCQLHDVGLAWLKLKEESGCESYTTSLDKSCRNVLCRCCWLRLTFQTLAHRLDIARGNQPTFGIVTFEFKGYVFD